MSDITKKIKNSTYVIESFFNFGGNYKSDGI
jgi:hypothetical protein